AGASLLVVLGMTWRQRHLAPSAQIQSIAVLPLDNLSGDSSQKYLADGMTDALITDLAQIRSLRVPSWTSVIQINRSGKSLPEIGRELNVDAVLEGSVVRSGSRIRITAQLIDTATDRHLWAHSYESDVRDVLALQDEVARDITQQIRAQLTAQEQARLARGRPVNPEAYDLYLRGRSYSSRLKGRDAIETTIGLFEQSVKLDSSFAPAHAFLARAYTVKAF